MNLHGYKQKSKAIASLIRREEEKESAEKCVAKLYRLKRARRRCKEKIGCIRKERSVVKK